LPAGGWLGLGTSAEVARELLHYADHLYFYNDISEKARKLLTGLEEGKFQAEKARVICDLHPFLYQFLSIRAAWEGGYASFIYPRTVQHSERHPLVHRVKSVFLPLVDYGAGLKTHVPTVQMAIGPRSYFANPKMMVMDPFLARLSAPYPSSTRDINLMSGKWKLIGDESESQDSQVLLDPEHPLTPAFDEFISFEIERLETALIACREHNAHFITDVPSDWAIIFALATSTADGVAVPPESSLGFAFDLTQDLAFLQNVPLDRLIGIREAMTSEFERFRGALLRLARSQTNANLEDRKREAALIVKEEIEPAIAHLAQRIEAAQQGLRDSVAAWVAVAAISGFLAFITGSPQVAAGSLPLLFKVLESRRKERELKQDEMYFLLNVREAGQDQR
jgi:hypothetical protein